MGYRHPNPRLVKIHRKYSIEEIARLFGLHKNTIRNWLRQGLPAIDDGRPMLILGRELSRFLQERRQRAKQSCGPGRIYCIACRHRKSRPEDGNRSGQRQKRNFELPKQAGGCSKTKGAAPDGAAKTIRR